MNDFDKEIFDIYLDKLTKESIGNQEARRYAEDKQKREALYISKLLKM